MSPAGWGSPVCRRPSQPHGAGHLRVTFSLGQTDASLAARSVTDHRGPPVPPSTGPRGDPLTHTRREDRGHAHPHHHVSLRHLSPRARADGDGGLPEVPRGAADAADLPHVYPAGLAEADRAPGITPHRDVHLHLTELE